MLHLTYTKKDRASDNAQSITANIRKKCGWLVKNEVTPSHLCQCIGWGYLFLVVNNTIIATTVVTAVAMAIKN